MDLLEVSAGLERIELLAKISNIDEASSKEKRVALQWIGEITEDLRILIRKETLDNHDSLREGANKFLI